MLRCYPLLLRRITLAVVFGCASLSAACGQKGPLYRPDQKAQQVTPATDSATASPTHQTSPASDSQTSKGKSAPVLPAPQSQKKDRENAHPADAQPADVQPRDAQLPDMLTTPPAPDRPAPAVPPSQPPEAG